VPAWRRHLPAALALAALAALVLALAKPQKTVAVPVERRLDHARDRPLALDVGNRRLARPACPPRSARRAPFLNQLPDQVRVGAVAFSDTPDAVQAPSSDHDDARRIVDGQVADGATATGARSRSPSTRSRTTSRTASARRRPSSCSPTARPPCRPIPSRRPHRRAS
jgi:Ca-activated chloride channel family protein